MLIRLTHKCTRIIYLKMGCLCLTMAVSTATGRRKKQNSFLGLQIVVLVDSNLIWHRKDVFLLLSRSTRIVVGFSLPTVQSHARVAVWSGYPFSGVGINLSLLVGIFIWLSFNCLFDRFSKCFLLASNCTLFHLLRVFTSCAICLIFCFPSPIV